MHNFGYFEAPGVWHWLDQCPVRNCNRSSQGHCCRSPRWASWGILGPLGDGAGLEPAENLTCKWCSVIYPKMRVVMGIFHGKLLDEGISDLWWYLRGSQLDLSERLVFEEAQVDRKVSSKAPTPSVGLITLQHLGTWIESWILSLLPS